MANIQQRLTIAVAAALALGCLAVTAWGQTEVPAADLKTQFRDSIRPFLEEFCTQCHAGESAEASLDLARYQTPQEVADDHRRWKQVIDKLQSGKMPPADEPQPSAAQRDAVIRWIDSFRTQQALQHAGDPGEVPVRRLSNAEYNYTIRDLTGVDIRPAREFPVDPANEAGFDNSSQSLAMSPALLTKYLDAARLVVDHLVLKADGFDFAPHPVVTDTDRDKYCVKRIITFYKQQPTDLADYFFAAWTFQNRDVLGAPDMTLSDVAAEQRVSPKYLDRVWSALSEPAGQIGPLAKLQRTWQALPADPDRREDVRQRCRSLRDDVLQLRRLIEPQVDDLRADAIHKGSQPFVLWKNRQYVANRRRFDRQALVVADDVDPENSTHAELIIPHEADRPRYEAAFARFADLFPDAFYVSERGRDYLGKSKDEQEKGRLLSAGFHSMMGYFRDDQPLYEMILDEDQQRQLDRLWQELDFVASAPMRQYTGFLWFERTDSRYMRDPEFDFARAEDLSALTEPNIQRLADLYLAKARRSETGPVELQAVATYFQDINQQIRWVEAARTAAEPSHLQALRDFAARAYRRVLTEAEVNDLLSFYRALRTEQDLSHEEALQDTIVSVLMSPLFCYRVDLLSTGAGIQRRSDTELASRLSYFLWSSMPDQPLLDAAASGELQDQENVRQQVRRMLRDDRVAALAREFGGNWLEFRQFEEHNAVDREHFPQFTNELREAMFQEPVRFFVDLIQHDRSVFEFLDARHTFVNPVLAQHYGITLDAEDDNKWQRIDEADRFGRGGLLPMSVFLTKNAPGLRTSPVKRGYWVVRRLLGEEIPPPPPDIPELPASESELGELTLAETLARHRDHASCAACHDRFDSIGLVFEGYGPIGEQRAVDLGGRPVSTGARFPDGSEREGIAGLQRYLQEQRREEFLENLCRKLLSYALGRTLLLSDDPLLQQMQADFQLGNDRFGSLIEQIVISPQFLNKGRSDNLVRK